MADVAGGGPNPDGGRRLVDYLLRPETEALLAEGGGYQFPLNPAVAVTPPAGLRGPAQTRPMAVDFEKAADLWESTQLMLRGTFGG